jgi:hypothetical protein
LRWGKESFRQIFEPLRKEFRQFKGEVFGGKLVEFEWRLAGSFREKFQEVFCTSNRGFKVRRMKTTKIFDVELCQKVVLVHYS